MKIQAQKRFNRLCKENEHLRKEIDDLRVSRRRFDDLYKKVDEQQEQLKLEIGQIVEQSTQAYEQRFVALPHTTESPFMCY